MRPASSRTRRCLDTAGWLMENGAPSSATDRSPPARLARMARRVGSARAPKTALSWSVGMAVHNLLVMEYVDIERPRPGVVNPLRQIVAASELRHEVRVGRQAAGVADRPEARAREAPVVRERELRREGVRRVDVDRSPRPVQRKRGARRGGGAEAVGGAEVDVH